MGVKRQRSCGWLVKEGLRSRCEGGPWRIRIRADASRCCGHMPCDLWSFSSNSMHCVRPQIWNMIGAVVM